MISTLLSALVVVIAGLSLFTPYFEKNAVEVRLKRALELRKKDVESSGRKLRDFNDEENVFIKALIEIRGKNEGFTLEQRARGVDDEQTAQTVMDGLRIYYDFLRPHMALDGKTPAQQARISESSTPENWKSLIKKASKSKLVG